MSYRVVNPYKWERAKAILFAVNLLAGISCIGGLEWEPTMGDPMFPSIEGAIFFGSISGFLAWRMGSTLRK